MKFPSVHHEAKHVGGGYSDIATPLKKSLMKVMKPTNMQGRERKRSDQSAFSLFASCQNDAADSCLACFTPDALEWC